MKNKEINLEKLRIGGFDTEEYNGNVKLLTYASIGYRNNYGDKDKQYLNYYFIEKNYVEGSNTENLLDFLFKYGQNNDYNYWYNLNYDISGILKDFIVHNINQIKEKFRDYDKYNRIYNDLSNKQILSDQEITELNQAEAYLKKFRKLDFEIGKYRVSVINGKSFSITLLHKKRNKGKRPHTVHFFDIANFFTRQHYGYYTLDETAKKYLHDEKNNEELGIDRKKIGEEQGYYEKNRELIIKYGLKDSELTARLGLITIISFKNLNMPFPAKPYSKGSIAKLFLKTHYPEYKENQKIYKEYSLFENFEKYYSGGYFGMFSVGYFDNVWELDINSAYPAMITKLETLIGSKWIDYEKNKKDFDKCFYKFYKVECKYNPYLFVKKKGRIFIIDDDKTGEFYITEYDKLILDLYNIPYKIISGIGIMTTGKLMFPDFNDLYDKKSEIKKKFGENSIEYSNVKIVMNSFYGIIAQSKPKTYKHEETNFIFASYITAYCRYKILKMAKQVKDDGNYLIQINTDSVIFSNVNNIDYSQYISKKLGDYQYEIYNHAVILGQGIYVYYDEKNNVIKMRNRGFSIKELNLPELLKSDEHIKIITDKSRPKKIAESVIQMIPEKIGVFLEQKKEFNPYKSISNKYKCPILRDLSFLEYSWSHFSLEYYSYNEKFKE